MKVPKIVRDWLKRRASKAGKIGGRARAEKLSPERRSEIAREAAKARWGKASNKQTGVVH